MSDFRADCGRCCGLCCVVPDHLAVQGFPVDKRAEIPCLHLDAQHQCAIHATRQSRGYSACPIFDCYGAGQWITQQLFRGARWSDSREIAEQMFAAYRHWVPRFEAAALIEVALPYVRSGARRRLAAMMTELTSVATVAPLGCQDVHQLRRETLTRLRSVLEANGQGDHTPAGLE